MVCVQHLSVSEKGQSWGVPSSEWDDLHEPKEKYYHLNISNNYFKKNIFFSSESHSLLSLFHRLHQQGTHFLMTEGQQVAKPGCPSVCPWAASAAAGNWSHSLSWAASIARQFSCQFKETLGLARPALLPTLTFHRVRHVLLFSSH